jgi:NADH dehydrogenase FAD-containing subunit
MVMSAAAQPKVVVLGGGFGGLEAAFSLRRTLGDHAQLTLVSDYDRFRFKPNTIYIPFGADPAKLEVPLREPLASRKIDFLHGRVQGVDPVANRVDVQQFEGMVERSVPYDYLVVATGAAMRTAEIPGLADYGYTVWTPADLLRLRRAFSQLVEDAKGGTHRQVLFLVPPHNLWSGPLYEVALLLESRLRRQHVRAQVDLFWSTYEASYLQALGPRLHAIVTGEFDRRGIHGFTQFAVRQVDRREVHYQNGGSLPFDLLVSFPPYVAAAPFPSLPSDERGFIATEPATRRVTNQNGVYAVGDAADFPLKQAFLACAQADVVAAQLAAEIRGIPCNQTFEPTTMYILEQAETGTFAEVPLRTSDDPLAPADVDPDKPDAYVLGTSPLWRAGKQLLGTYVPWRFRSGHPIHGGLPGEGMTLGEQAMAAALGTRAPRPG